MKNKRTILAAAIAGLFASTVAAQEDYSLTLDLTFGSQYVFRGIEFGEDTLHPSIEFSKDDFYLGVWAALPLEKQGSKGFVDEYDFYGGQGWALNESISLDVGGTYYYYPNDRDTFEGYAGISGDIDGFTPSFYVYRDFDLETWTVEVSGGYTMPLRGEMSLELAIYAGQVEVDGSSSEDYSYYGADAVIPFQVNESTTISIGAHYGDHDLRNLPDSHFYGTASITMGF